MVRLADLPPTKRESMQSFSCPTFATQPWVAAKPLRERTVTLISSAGLIVRGDRPLTPRDTRYRTIAHDLDANEILMSHVSVNFDRTGFQQDLNVVLPRGPLQSLADAGVIGAVSQNHYAFMGATEAHLLEPSARKLAAELHAQGVDSAVLVPV